VAPKSTFRLTLPDDRQVDVHVIELEDGSIVVRSGAELARAADAAKAAPRG